MKARFADHPRTGLFLFLAVYACVLVALLPVLSLWLDEIMDLMVVRSAGMRELLAGVAVNSGNAPLNYIIQFWTVHVLGYSAFAGRLPEAIFSLASCAGIYVLARRLRLRWPLLAVAVFALFPLQFRYALEARPYSLALALSIWSTVAFFRLLDQPRSLPRATLYTSDRRRRRLRASVHAVRGGRASCLGAPKDVAARRVGDCHRRPGLRPLVFARRRELARGPGSGAGARNGDLASGPDDPA